MVETIAVVIGIGSALTSLGAVASKFLRRRAPNAVDERRELLAEIETLSKSVRRAPDEARVEADLQALRAKVDALSRLPTR